MTSAPIIYLSLVLGIVISLVLPLIRAMLPKPPQALASGELWEVIRPYVATAVFSAVVGLLLMAMLPDLCEWNEVLIYGYLWASTLQKATTGNASATLP